MRRVALRDYEPRISEYTQQLLDRLERSKGEPLDVSTLFNFYSFDVMGDLAFGKGFGMLKEGIVHYYMESVHANMLAVSAFSHLVWIFPLLKAIPGLNNEHLVFQKWLEEQVHLRRQVRVGGVVGAKSKLTPKQRKPNDPDLFSWILADYEALPKPTPQNTIDLHGDAHLIIVAGRYVIALTKIALIWKISLIRIYAATPQRRPSPVFSSNYHKVLKLWQSCAKSSTHIMARMNSLRHLLCPSSHISKRASTRPSVYTLL